MMKEVPTGVKIIAILEYIGAGVLVLIPFLMMAFSSLGGFGFGAIAGAFSFIIFIPFAVLFFFIGRGLWKAQNWARVVAIILSSIAFLAALMNIIQGNWNSIISLLINGVIGGYLWFSGEVKQAFA